MFVFAGLFTVIASAALMQALGLSTALGAFVAGVMLADSPYRHELEADVEPFRSILLGLFFLAIGMLLDLTAIAQRPFFVIGMALALIATKATAMTGIGLAFRMKWRQALVLGLLLSQGGEFGFVLFAQAQRGLLIAPEAASLFGAIITLSMATTPFLMRVTQRIRTEPAAAQGDRDTPKMDGANALVVGYGRFGQTVAQMLIAQGIPVTLIDNDIEMIDVAGSFGAKVYYGDGTRMDPVASGGRARGGTDPVLHRWRPDGTRTDRRSARGVSRRDDLRARVRPPGGHQTARRAGRICRTRGDGIRSDDGAARADQPGRRRGTDRQDRGGLSPPRPRTAARAARKR